MRGVLVADVLRIPVAKALFGTGKNEVGGTADDNQRPLTQVTITRDQYPPNFKSDEKNGSLSTASVFKKIENNYLSHMFKTYP